jgi:hypothetical protein
MSRSLVTIENLRTVAQEAGMTWSRVLWPALFNPLSPRRRSEHPEISPIAPPQRR